jgi:hypothetical protein
LSSASTRYAAILETLDSEGRAQLEVTVEEILDEVGRADPDCIEAAADMVEDAIFRQPDDEAAVVAMMIVASLREHAVRTRHGLN